MAPFRSVCGLESHGFHIHFLVFDSTLVSLQTNVFHLLQVCLIVSVMDELELRIERNGTQGSVLLACLQGKALLNREHNGIKQLIWVRCAKISKGPEVILVCYTQYFCLFH